MNDNKPAAKSGPPLPPPLTEAGKAAAKAARARAGKKKEKADGGSDTRAVRSGAVALNNHDSNKPADAFAYVFGPQHKAVRDYLRCVFEPDKYTARVPASQGSFELLTELWRTRESGVIVAGSDGTAVLGLCAPNWVEAGNGMGEPFAGSQVLGYTTMGAASQVSQVPADAYAGTFPVQGSVVDAAWKATPLDRPTDTPLDAQSRIRLVAMQLKVHSVLANNTAKGEMLLCGTVNPVGGPGAGSINGCTWDQIIKTNDGVMTRAVIGLPNWKPGKSFSIVAIPAEDQAFQMCEIPASGITVSPVFHLGFLARSMTAGDSISYEVTYVWETELAKTNRAETFSAAVIPVPASTLQLAAAKARPYAASNQHPGIHALPWIETLAQTEPSALAALERHPTMRPHVESAQAKRPAVSYQAPDTGFWGKLFEGGKALHKAVTNTGLLTAVPVIGAPLQAAASLLSSLFD